MIPGFITAYCIYMIFSPFDDSIDQGNVVSVVFYAFAGIFRLLWLIPPLVSWLIYFVIAYFAK